MKQEKFDKRYWKKLYYSLSHSLFRRIAFSYGDNEENFKECKYTLEKFIDFEKELFTNYFDKKGVREIQFKDYEELCNKYIHQAKENNNFKAVEFFFDLYKEYYVEYVHFTNYIRQATEEEVKKADEDFGYVQEYVHNKKREHYHTFKDAKVLEYRGLRLPIDDQWGDAWIKDENGHVHSFQLIWDWNYPIDQYITYHIL